MIEYSSFNIAKSILISGRFKEKDPTRKTLVRKHNIRTISYGWLDHTNEPAAGCDMYCYSFDSLRMLRARYNSNQPAISLDYYAEDCFFEDVIKEKFIDEAFKIQ